MAYELRDFSDVAPATSIASDITNVSPTITVASGTGYPSGGVAGDFIIQVESELIRCSARSGDTLTVSGGVAGRGINGTSAASHVTGVAVNHVHTAVLDSKEANYAVSKTVGKVTTSQDLLVADGANSFTRLPIGANGTILQAIAGALAYGTLTIGADTITATEIAPSAVGSSELGASAVVAGKIAAGTVVNADVNAAAAIALSKLATDPLARSNHTGTQLLATISNAGSLASLSTVVDANITNATITAGKMAATPWTSFTPTAGGSGWAFGNATLNCSYMQLGKTVHAHYDIVWGSGSSFGAGTFTVTLPVTAIASKYTGQGFGILGGSGTFDIILRAISTTVCEFNVSGSVTTAMLGVSSTSPASWANGHTLAADIVYQAA